MDNTITANDLKVKGVSSIDDVTSKYDEAVISVRGKGKYIPATSQESSNQEIPSI